jgi:hypothetical protein
MAFMGLIASQRMSAELKTLAQAAQRLGPHFRFFARRTENVVQSGYNQSYESCAMLGGSYFGSMQNLVRQIDGGLHEQ